MKLSIVITTFNRAECLKANLLEFAKQTDTDFEVIVAMDGCTDKTEDMLSELLPALPYELRWVDTGETGKYCLGKARNMGILESTGEAVVILDDDTFPTPEFVQEHKRTARPRTITCGYRNSHDPADELHAKMKSQMQKLKQGKLNRIKGVENNACMYREDWIGCGLFSERIEGYGGVGQEFMPRLRFQGFGYQFNPKAMAYHHREYEGVNGLTRDKKSEQHTANLAQLRKFFPKDQGDAVPQSFDDLAAVPTAKLSGIQKTIEEMRYSYALHHARSRRALILAPYGQEYFDDGLKHLTASRAVRALVAQGKLDVLIFTSKRTKISRIPEGYQVLAISDVPRWPPAPALQNRFIKWAIPLLFPNIGSSIYLDTDLRITHSSERLSQIFATIEDKKFILSLHPRSGWQTEYEKIVRKGAHDNRELLEQQRRLFLALGIPEQIAFYQCNFIGRRHDALENNPFYLNVLQQLNCYSGRDQLAVAYALFVTDIKPYSLPVGEDLFAYAPKLQNNMPCFVDEKAWPRFKQLALKDERRKKSPVQRILSWSRNPDW
ncbi:MAG: glycosyltransferase [Candidatus Omnitrophota bacterium]|nr:glycosyltransferase [Candidatus Omnitrophota bacterium]